MKKGRFSRSRLGGALVAAFVSAFAVLLGACDDDRGGGRYYGSAQSVCAQYAACGTCTPVLGCGWCFNATGGVCVTDPDQCATQVSEFTWTWDPSGCPGVDASVEPIDGGVALPDASSDSEATSADGSDSVAE